MRDSESWRPSPVDIRELAKDFVIANFGVRESFFNTAWDVLSNRYGEIRSAAGQNPLALLGQPLGIAGAEQSEAIKIIIIFVGADKVATLQTTDELLATVRLLCEKYEASERNTREILSRLTPSATQQGLVTETPQSHQRPFVQYATKWTNQTSSDGDLIDRDTFDQLLASRADYKIFIIDGGDYLLDAVGKTYLNQELIVGYPGRHHHVNHPKDGPKGPRKDHLTPLEYKLLVYTLKNMRNDNRRIVDYIRHCWANTKDADTLDNLSKQDRTIFDIDTSAYRKKLAELSTFLNTKLGIYLQTGGTSRYGFTRWPSFCLLEVIQSR
jgi:hypothetical protein